MTTTTDLALLRRAVLLDPGTPGEVQVNGDSGLIFITEPLTATDATRTVFVATRACRFKAVKAVFTTASSSGTLQIEKCTSTTAPGSGTSLLTGTVSLAGTANTVVSGTLTGTVADQTLAAGVAGWLVWRLSCWKAEAAEMRINWLYECDRRQKLETSLLSMDDRIDELQAEIAGLEKVIESKDAELARQAASLKDSRAECAELAAANMALARQCDDLKVQIESARRRAAAILGFVKDLVGDLQEWKITHAADGSAVPGR